MSNLKELHAIYGALLIEMEIMQGRLKMVKQDIIKHMQEAGNSPKVFKEVEELLEERDKLKQKNSVCP